MSDCHKYCYSAGQKLKCNTSICQFTSSHICIYFNNSLTSSSNEEKEIMINEENECRKMRHLIGVLHFGKTNVRVVNI